MVVKRSGCLLCILAPMVLASQVCYAQYDAKSLRGRLDSEEQQTTSAANRLKSSQGDVGSIQVLQNHDITYTLPNGTLENGILLPNGKIAPAYTDKTGTYPACVTKDYLLIRGKWNPSKQIIECEVPLAELAVISLEESAQQGSTHRSGGTSDTPQSSKYSPATGGHDQRAESDPKTGSATSSHDSTRARSTSTVYAAREQSSGTNIYHPPSSTTSSSRPVAGVMSSSTKKFGVPMGTWVQAELVRSVSTAESGEIEIRLTEDLVGKYRTLPSGTTIFARQSINEPERRLEALGSIAITPNGSEFNNVFFRLYSLNKTAGIAGTLIRDREGEIATTGTNVALNTLSAMTPAVAGPTGQAVGGLASGMLENERRNIPRTPRTVVRVEAQPVLLKVAKSF